MGILYFDYYNTVTDMITKKGVTLSDMQRWADMIEKWPYYMRFEVGGRDVVVVHAGFCEDDAMLKEANRSFNDFCLYAREEGLKLGGVRNGMIIAGHTPTIARAGDNEFYNDGKVFRFYDVEKDCIFYDIDCGCVFREAYPSGALACLKVEDEETIYM